MVRPWYKESADAGTRVRRTEGFEGACWCSMSALAREADIKRTSQKVRVVPCVDGSGLARRIFTSRRWSVRPCVRPVSAAHGAAGHNALRGSGPGQNPAFDNAL